MENKNNNEAKVATTAERLRAALTERKMSAATLSRLSEISEGSISRYISGVMAPRHATMLLLAQVLNVSDTWLYGYDVPMERPDPFKEGDKLAYRALSEQEKQREDGNTFPEEMRTLQGGGLSVTELGLIEEFRKLTVADQVEVLALCLKLAKKEASER